MDGNGPVETLVGRGLFVFGDRDGPGRVADATQRMTTEALLQHCVGVAYHDGKLYVADTYNSKIKTIDLSTGMVTTFLGGPAKQGEEPVLNEPTGLTIAGDTMYVADTNAHRIRVVESQDQGRQDAGTEGRAAGGAAERPAEAEEVNWPVRPGAGSAAESSPAATTATDPPR